jgi:Mn-containing catalase
VYEYLMQFTDDPLVKESLGFLMTREIAHFQMFAAALHDIAPNFPPGVLQGDPRFTHTYFNMSEGDAKGDWNQGQGPWRSGEEWVYIGDPISHVRQTEGLKEEEIAGSSETRDSVAKKDEELSEMRSSEVKSSVPSSGILGWSDYSAMGGGLMGSWKSEESTTKSKSKKPVKS